MSTAPAYNEPYRFSAGMLALAMHLAFFAMLYFGVRWQSRPPESFTVEMWDNLPNAEAVSELEPLPPPKMEPIPPPKVVPPVLPPVKADIEVRDKKSKKPDLKDKQSKKDAKKEAKARQEAELRELEAYSERIRKNEQVRVQAEQERVRAEVSAATKVQVERYQDMIRNKIRRKMKMVADVPANAEAIFKITLLPDGMLMENPVLVKSSGFPAYDDAAARAILSAEPLPVPTDESLQKMFRELKLSIRP
ncbi:MAG: cell envelope integrity protein TolA [Nitrosomonadales bacterium]|nr:cell envelope integrity protein TolA [Nitrosomonadales bacterium]